MKAGVLWCGAAWTMAESAGAYALMPGLVPAPPASSAATVRRASFPPVLSLTAPDRWYNAPEYQPLIALRQSAVDMGKDMMIAVDAA
jgi:hypothetical protein